MEFFSPPPSSASNDSPGVSCLGAAPASASFWVPAGRFHCCACTAGATLPGSALPGWNVPLYMHLPLGARLPAGGVLSVHSPRAFSAACLYLGYLLHLPGWILGPPAALPCLTRFSAGYLCGGEFHCISGGPYGHSSLGTDISCAATTRAHTSTLHCHLPGGCLTGTLLPACCLIPRYTAPAWAPPPTPTSRDGGGGPPLPGRSLNRYLFSLPRGGWVRAGHRLPQVFCAGVRVPGAWVPCIF